MSALRVNTKHTDSFSHVLIAMSIMFCSRSPDFNQSFLEFILILERCLIDLLLHDSPEFVIGRIEVRAVGVHISGETKSVWGFALQQLNRFARRCAVLLKHKCVTSDVLDSMKYYNKKVNDVLHYLRPP